LLANTAVYDFILLLASLLLLGMLLGKLFEHYRIPNISGYLTLGLIAGVVLVRLEFWVLYDVFVMITTFALGFIAFNIGLELRLEHLKGRRKEVFVITMTQAMMTFVVTTLGLFVFRLPLSVALVLGAIAIATEPGPILQMTKRLKIHNDLSDTLVPLHGIEDAFAILVFGFALAFAQFDQSGTFSAVALLYGPVYELVFTLLVALLIGIVFYALIHWIPYDDIDKNTFVFVGALTAVLFATAFANRGFALGSVHVHLSPVLLPMGVGMIFSNLSTPLAKKETEAMVDQFAPPILIIFFVVVGIEMVYVLFGLGTRATIATYVLMAAVYIVFRILGKVLGSYLGGTLAQAPMHIRKYLGFCLIPQAQAAIGLAFYARYVLGEPYGDVIVFVVIIGSLVYEWLGPFGLRHSLMRCEEITQGTCVIRPRHRFTLKKPHRSDVGTQRPKRSEKNL